ncbi:MAG: hypothetical protein AAF974_12640, partial [Cyanobacteria bacterium P01_E01_bin.34]
MASNVRFFSNRTVNPQVANSYLQSSTSFKREGLAVEVKSPDKHKKGAYPANKKAAYRPAVSGCMLL